MIVNSQTKQSGNMLLFSEFRSTGIYNDNG